MHSWLIISGNELPPSGAAGNFLGAVSGDTAPPLVSDRPADGGLDFSRANPTLHLRDQGHFLEVHEWVRHQQERKRTAVAASTGAGALQAWAAPKMKISFHDDNGAHLMFCRPGADDQGSYALFGPFWRRFWLLTTHYEHGATQGTLQLEERAADGTTEGRFQPEERAADARSQVCWNPVKIPERPPEEWECMLAKFGGALSACNDCFLLPMWNDHAEEGYFTAGLLALRGAMRKITKYTVPKEDEPLAVAMWRAADQPEFREVLRAGGKLRVSGIGCGSKTSVEIRMRQPNGKVNALWHGFLRGESPLSRLGESFRSAFMEDLEAAVAPASVGVGDNTEGRDWPYVSSGKLVSNTRAAGDQSPLLQYLRHRRWDADNDLKTTFDQLAASGQSQPEVDLLRRLVADYWQPTGANGPLGNDPTFWTSRLLFQRELLLRELSGSQRPWRDRLDAEYCRPKSNSPLRQVTVLGRTVECAEVMETALLAPPGTEITILTNMELDNEDSLLDSGLCLA